MGNPPSVVHACVAFGATSLSACELMHATTRQARTIFFHVMSMENTTRARWFDFFDNHFNILATEYPVRVCALYKRDHRRVTNAWFHHHERVRCCTVPASMTSFPFKQMKPPTLPPPPP